MLMNFLQILIHDKIRNQKHSPIQKDYKLAKRRGLDINLLKGIITKLANGEVLAPKHKDHPLSGDWVGHRECHIQPDWLLVYPYDNDVLVLTLSRTSTHSDLFGL